MFTNNTLFERSSRMTSTSDRDEGVEEDVWDDRKLNDAYDKALKIASAEVAKRVAMSTNTQGKSEDSKPAKKAKGKQAGACSSKTKPEWKAGMACRAMYEEDGLEYEAFVIRIVNEKECIVRFLGYDNCEVVALDSLLPSLGKQERKKQMEEAAQDKSEDEDPPNLEWKEVDSQRAPSPGSTEYSYERKQKSPRKKKSQKQANSDQMPEMPFPMSNLSMMPNLGMMPNLSSLDLPMPPPPPMAMPQERIGTEDQALSSMLLSWYMSGYYTGLYQGMKRAKQSRRRV